MTSRAYTISALCDREGISRQSYYQARSRHRTRRAGINMGRDRLFDLLRTTHGAATRWTNQLAEADVAAPNQAWVADITYLRTLDGFCYLALVSDKYSRKILDWDLADSLELQGALNALEEALGGLRGGGQADPPLRPWQPVLQQRISEYPAGT